VYEGAIGPLVVLLALGEAVLALALADVVGPGPESLEDVHAAVSPATTATTPRAPATRRVPAGRI